MAEGYHDISEGVSQAPVRVTYRPSGASKKIGHQAPCSTRGRGQVLNALVAPKTDDLPDSSMSEFELCIIIVLILMFVHYEPGSWQVAC